jgi:uncharacterized membrane protein YhaH (DUF805 family)
MQPLSFLFSPSGRLSPQTFAYTAILIYIAGAASQFLTIPDVVVFGGLWPFVVVQALLLWVWFAAHAKRLRDAGSPIGWAIGASVLYALSIILLLLIVVAAFIDTPAKDAANMSATGALGVVLLVTVIAVLLGSTQQHDLTWLVTTVLVVMAFLPIIVALAVTLWAATRPSLRGRTA